MARLNSFLTGVRVLDLSQYIPGPFASQLLADMGAGVLKVEPPGGDEMRTLGPRGAASEPLFYRVLNAGKSVTRIDLKSDAGHRAMLAHVATADVLIEGFRPGVMARLGLDYATLAALRPELVYCSISGYGATGPLAATAAHDGNYLATAGVLDRNSVDCPAAFDPPVADLAGALFAAVAILGALHGRRASGRGAHIDLGLADALMPLQSLAVAAWGANGAVPRARASYLNGGAAYYQTYRTADARHVMLGSVEPKFWRAFCEAAERADWTHRYAEPMPQTALIADLAAFFGALPLARVVERFGGVDCCLSPVLDLGEALTSGQIAARGLVQRHGGDLQALFPARIDGEASHPRAPLTELAA